MRLYENQRGQVLPIVAISLAALMGFGAFAVDLGYLRYQQRLQQTAADAAAIQAAWQLQLANNPTSGSCGDPTQPGAPAAVCSAGQTAASKNFFTSPSSCVSTTKTCVSINYPPASGAYQGYNSAAEALVTVQQPGFFSPLLGRSTNPVTTRAVAVIRGNPNGNCIYAMSGDYSDNGGANLSAPCGVLVGGSFKATSNNSVANVPSIGAVGSVNCPIPQCSSTVVQSQGIVQFSDPCQTIPGCAALTASNAIPLGSSLSPNPYFASCGTAPSGSSLTPGCYNGISASSTTIDLAPGLYTIHGNIDVNGFTCSTCSSSTGVSIVTDGYINMNNGSSSIHAPPAQQGVGMPVITALTGAPGVLFYETGSGGSCHSNSNQQQNFGGSLVGMIYAPDCHMNTNQSTLTISFIVVALINANSSIVTVPAAGYQGYPQTPTLAE